MKNIKMLVSTVMVCAMGVFSTLAQNNETSYFSGNELSLGLGTTYTTENGFNKTYDFNLDVSASYFVTKYFGITATLPFYSNHGVSVDRVSAGLVARLPIKAIAPYISVGSQYQWLDKDFNYYAAGGVEWRFAKKWGVYIEDRYIVDALSKTDIKVGQNQIRAGISLVF